MVREKYSIHNVMFVKEKRYNLYIVKFKIITGTDKIALYVEKGIEDRHTIVFFLTNSSIFSAFKFN